MPNFFSCHSFITLHLLMKYGTYFLCVCYINKQPKCNSIASCYYYLSVRRKSGYTRVWFQYENNSSVSSISRPGFHGFYVVTKDHSLFLVASEARSCRISCGCWCISRDCQVDGCEPFILITEPLV